MKRLLLLLLVLISIASSAFAESEFSEYRRKNVATRFCGTLMSVLTGRQIQVAATGVTCVFTSYTDGTSESSAANFSTAEVVIGTGGQFCQPITASEINIDGYMRIYCESGGIANSTAYQLTLVTIKSDVADGAISSTTFAAGAIDSAAIAANAIGASEIASSAITAGTFATGAIDANAIASGAIDNTAIAGGAIGSLAFAAGAIDSAAIAANAIGSSEIAAGAITNAKFAAGAIDSTTIAANAIGSSQLASGAITNTKFASGAIDSTTLSANAIGSSQLASGAITATKFAASAIDSTVVATDAIGATQLATSAATEISGNLLATSLPELSAVPDDTAQTVQTNLRALYQRTFNKVTDDNVLSKRIFYKTGGAIQLCHQPLTKVGNVFTTGVCVP